MRLLTAFLLLCSLLSAFYLDVSNTTISNGQTVLLEFKAEKGLVYKEIKFDKKRFQIFKNPFHPEKYYALIPIGYYEKPSNKELVISYKEGKRRESKLLFLKVKDGAYPKEEIHVSSKKVNPRGKEVKKRISQEYNEAMKIYHTVTRKSYLSSAFILPLESKITSSFGKARVYNGSLKGYHSGTDFRAKMGTPIVAANDGKVVLVKKRFYSGGTVLLDHGEGIYTCYFHMSKFNVKKGEIVSKGQVLGLSGKSGRVTGPHLHFSARINGVQVDPLQLISLINNNLLKGN